jgi:hypothetical protein
MRRWKRKQHIYDPFPSAFLILLTILCNHRHQYQLKPQSFYEQIMILAGKPGVAPVKKKKPSTKKAGYVGAKATAKSAAAAAQKKK